MSKKRIFLDAGHGGKDPGAVKYIVEADAAIKVVKYAGAYLRKYDCVVYEDITDDSLAVITHRANEWNADLFVSVHFNAGGGDGFEAWVYDKSRTKLGQFFVEEMLRTGQNSRGIKYDPELIVLNSTDMPAILLEGAFVDNKKDAQDWDEDSELKVMGEAYAKAVIKYFGLRKKVPEYKVLTTTLLIRERNTSLSKKIGTLRKGDIVSGSIVGDWLHHSKGYSRIKSTKKTYMKRVD